MRVQEVISLSTEFGSRTIKLLVWLHCVNMVTFLCVTWSGSSWPHPLCHDPQCDLSVDPWPPQSGDECGGLLLWDFWRWPESEEATTTGNQNLHLYLPDLLTPRRQQSEVGSTRTRVHLNTPDYAWLLLNTLSTIIHFEYTWNLITECTWTVSLLMQWSGCSPVCVGVFACRLMQHMLQHSELIGGRGGADERTFCKFCYRQFSSPAQLQSHQEQVHGPVLSSCKRRIWSCTWKIQNKVCSRT